MSLRNQRWILKERPAGVPGPEHFALAAAPVRPPGQGEVLLETLYVSVDPAMRVWMSESPGYVEPVPIGGVMRAGGIGRVLESAAPELAPGALVQGRLGWQSHPTLPARYLTELDTDLGGPLDWMGPLGGTALTAYFGLLDIGRPEPGETVLVSAAAGGVGQMAVQIARRHGCHVVGIAGGARKCAYLTEELGVDAAIDHRAVGDGAADLERAIAEACLRGVDVYFDNVGGATLDAAIARLNPRGRVVLCGRISQTPRAGQEAGHGVRNLGLLIGKRARMEGFIVKDFSDRYGEARAWLGERLRRGEITQRLHVLDGLGRAPEGLGMLFRGENTGKLVVRVAGSEVPPSGR